MTETFSRSFQLVVESFRILKKDKELMLFPVISFILTALLFGIFIGAPFYFGVMEAVKTGKEIIQTMNEWGFLISVFLFGIFSYFILNFFEAGLINCAYIRLNGGNPSFKDGIKKSGKSVEKIFTWSLISGTIGFILNRISKSGFARVGILYKIIGIVGHIAWELLTFFILPVIIFENLGMKESIEKSGHLFKKTWGENVIGQFSMRSFLFAAVVVSIVISIPIFKLLQHFTALPSNAVGLLFFTYELFTFLIIFGVIRKTLEGIFVAALYIYATTGKIPADYSPEVIKNAFVPKSYF